MKTRALDFAPPPGNPLSQNASAVSGPMPNDNEARAYPKEWVPGGETKSGIKEAVLIGSEKIDHEGGMNKLLSQFNEWEKL